MNLLIPVGLVAVIIIAWFAFARERSGGNNLTLEEKLQALEQYGLKLDPRFTVENLLEQMDRSEYEKPGWEMVLLGLGSEDMEVEPTRYYCKNLWYFDTECIEDNGDYKRIAERLAEMAQGSLPIENVKDNIDIEEETAWVSFTLNGRETKIDLKLEDDWVDTEIFSAFAKLLAQTDPSKTYIYLDLHGQDCLIGCVTKDQLAQLKQLGTKLEPMTD